MSRNFLKIKSNFMLNCVLYEKKNMRAHTEARIRHILMQNIWKHDLHLKVSDANNPTEAAFPLHPEIRLWDSVRTVIKNILFGTRLSSEGLGLRQLEDTKKFYLICDIIFSTWSSLVEKIKPQNRQNPDTILICDIIVSTWNSLMEKIKSQARQKSDTIFLAI